MIQSVTKKRKFAATLMTFKSTLFLPSNTEKILTVFSIAIDFAKSSKKKKTKNFGTNPIKSHHNSKIPNKNPNSIKNDEQIVSFRKAEK